MALALKTGGLNLKANNNFQLVANQVGEKYQKKDPRLTKYLKKVCDLSEHFKASEIVYMLRIFFLGEHSFKPANTKKIVRNHSVIQETLASPNIEIGKTISLEVAYITRWMTSIIQYLQLYELPLDELEAKKIRKHTSK